MDTRVPFPFEYCSTAHWIQTARLTLFIAMIRRIPTAWMAAFFLSLSLGLYFSFRCTLFYCEIQLSSQMAITQLHNWTQTHTLKYGNMAVQCHKMKTNFKQACLSLGPTLDCRQGYAIAQSMRYETQCEPSGECARATRHICKCTLFGGRNQILFINGLRVCVYSFPVECARHVDDGNAVM